MHSPTQVRAGQSLYSYRSDQWQTDTETGLCALETAVQPPALDELPDVLARLQAAHALIIQVRLLSGAEAWSTCVSGRSAWERALAGGDATAVALLEEWDRGGTTCVSVYGATEKVEISRAHVGTWTDAEHVQATKSTANWRTGSGCAALTVRRSPSRQIRAQPTSRRKTLEVRPRAGIK